MIRVAAVAVTLTTLTVACGKGSQSANGAGAGQTTASTSMTDSSSGSAGRSAAANGGANGTSAGEVAPSSDISQMSDSNIVAKLDAGDKAEVALAKVMETKASNDSVKAYARKLVTDHTKSDHDLMQLERTAKLAEKPLSSDTTRQEETHMLQKLRGMSKGNSLDSAFVQHEIDDHRHDIADAKAMQNQAKNPQLKEAIQQELPTLQQHLEIAQRLSQQLSNGGSEGGSKRP